MILDFSPQPVSTHSLSVSGLSCSDLHLNKIIKCSVYVCECVCTHARASAYVGSAGTGAHVEARGGCQVSHAHILYLSPGDKVPLILELG